MTHARDEVIRKLYPAEGDPFAGFDPAGWADPADEWDSHHSYFDECVAELRPRVIVEVGSFLGVSSRHFANQLAQRQIDGCVVCVDTWLAERVLWGVAQWRPHLRITNGRPETFKVWMANAVLSGLTDYLCPLPMDSRGGARYLSDRGVVASLIYIDGSHERGDVIQDLALYWDQVLAPGGVMLVDDYQHTADFAGVVHDVDQFVCERGLRLDVRGTKALLRKAA